MLAALWVLSHVLTAIAVMLRRYSAIYSIVAIAFIVAILILKQNTYDLEWYLPYMEDPYPLEPIFYGGTLFLSKVLTLKPELILVFWQTIIFLSLMPVSSLISERKRSPFLALLIIIGSVFFVLASQNGLRQGVAVSLLLYFYVLYAVKKNSVRLFIISSSPLILIHYSSAMFIVILMMYFYFKEKKKGLWVLGIFLSIMYGFVLQYFIGIYSEFYATIDIDWGDERTPSVVKFIVIATVFSLSSAFFCFAKDPVSRDFLRLRLYTFSSTIPLAFTGEFFARYMYFYYAVELIAMLVVIGRERNLIARTGVSLIVLAYGFAPNAINVIVGGGKL